MRGVLAFLLIAFALPAAAAELIGPKELQAAWLDGRTVTTTGPRGGKSEFAFSADGKVTRTGGRAGSPGVGTWRLDDEGFCMKLGQSQRESCYLALKDGESLKVIRRAGGAFVWTR